MAERDGRFLVVYTGEGVVDLGPVGNFSNGTRAYVSEATALKARSLAGFTVEAPDGAALPPLAPAPEPHAAATHPAPEPKAAKKKDAGHANGDGHANGHANGKTGSKKAASTHAH